MPKYRVIFKVPAEILVDVKADSEEEAADKAWDLANELTESSGLQSRSGGFTRIELSIDGIGDDSTEVIEP